MNDGFSGTVTAAMGKSSVTPQKLSNGVYRIQIRNIPAHQLGTTYTVTGNAGGAFTIKVSALSYVKQVLDSADTSKFDNDTAHYAVASLYKYYDAAHNYNPGA